MECVWVVRGASGSRGGDVADEWDERNVGRRARSGSTQSKGLSSQPTCVSSGQLSVPQ